MNQIAEKHGCWPDAAGRLVPKELVKPIDRLRDELVRALIGQGEQIAAQIAAYKAGAFADIASFVELSLEQYGVKVGGRKGNLTLTSFDGKYKITRSVQESISFDERLQAAKELIDECIQTWTEGSRPEIRALINDAFQVDKEGKISTGRVLGLKRLEISDEKWTRAMKAIADSVRTDTSTTYIRLYQRVGDTERYEPISLDMAVL
ncbi:DUF3164 family protein [Stagnimonas aquatica]|uniref:DUF3164 family protein n=1 Tax=Stagnimonas aquatica TaxID=2689987 RepID=A0A3N0V7F5_9GAMM|nr:DUF3164 family protein [Stagnimonas aquatica]ROH88649.1 DUF3164 family protein [Stagnimonas aquatica]